MANDVLALPGDALIVLCGPAGAGKSTFAAEVIRRGGLAATAAVSSDACRLLLCDETSTVTPAEWPILQPQTFDLFLTVVGMRLRLGRPTLADGVNLHLDLRPRLRDLARAHGRSATLVAFDVSLEACLARNAQRARRMPAEQIRGQRALLEEALPHLAAEGWDRLVVVTDGQPLPSIVVAGP